MTETTCEIIELSTLAPDITLIRLRLPNGIKANHFAGQYAKLRINNRWLAFSIANTAQDSPNELTFHFRHLAHHASSQEHLTWLSQKQLVRVSLPHGHCYLDHPPQRPLWLICGSTGFAQAKAILDFLSFEAHSGDIKLFWGARKQADFYLNPLPARWGKHLSNFEFIPVLSDEQHQDLAQGDVYQAALQHLTHPLKPLFFLSGSPAMVETTCQALVNAGVHLSQIKSDMLNK